MNRLIRIVLIFLIPCQLLAEASTFVMVEAISATPQNIADIHSSFSFSDQALTGLARQFPNLFVRRQYIAQIQVETRGARQDQSRKTLSRQERIDRVSIYGVSWWFEPALTLGALCFIPWAAASLSPHDFAFLSPALVGLSFSAFLTKHWDGVFVPQTDGTFVYQKFRHPNQSWKEGMTNRLRAWRKLSLAGIVFHLPFYIVFLGLAPYAHITMALHQLIRPFIWAMGSHLAYALLLSSDLIPRSANLASRWSLSFATGIIHRRNEGLSKENIFKAELGSGREVKPERNMGIDSLIFFPLKLSSEQQDQLDTLCSSRGMKGIYTVVASRIADDIHLQFLVKMWSGPDKTTYLRTYGVDMNDEGLNTFMNTLIVSTPKTAILASPFATDRIESIDLNDGWMELRHNVGKDSEFSPKARQEVAFAPVKGQALKIKVSKEFTPNSAERILTTVGFVKVPYTDNAIVLTYLLRPSNESAIATAYLLAEHYARKPVSEREFVRHAHNLDENEDSSLKIGFTDNLSLSEATASGELPSRSAAMPREQAGLRAKATQPEFKETSPDGRIAISEKARGQQSLIDIDSGKPLSLEGGPYKFFLSFSPRSNTVIGFKEVVKWRESVPVLLDLISHPGKAVPHAFMAQIPNPTKLYWIHYSPRGRYIDMFDSVTGVTTIFDVETMKQAALPPAGYCSFYPDEKLVEITSPGENVVHLIEVASQNEIPLPKGTTGFVFFSKPSRVLAYQLHKWAKVYDLNSKETLATRPNLWGSQVSLSPDGRTVVVILNAAEVQPNAALMDSEGNMKLLPGINGIVDEVKFSPDGKRVSIELRNGTKRTFAVAFDKPALPSATWGLSRRVAGLILDLMDHTNGRKGFLGIKYLWDIAFPVPALTAIGHRFLEIPQSRQLAILFTAA